MKLFPIYTNLNSINNLYENAKNNIFKLLKYKFLTKFYFIIWFDKITYFFSIVDEFYKDFDKTTQPFLLGKPSKRPSIMSKFEVITIYLLFHLSGFRCFKHY